eukprot:1926686-Pleurochrysis_carterae.AAC.2
MLAKRADGVSVAQSRPSARPRSASVTPQVARFGAGDDSFTDNRSHNSSRNQFPKPNSQRCAIADLSPRAAQHGCFSARSCQVTPSSPRYVCPDGHLDSDDSFSASFESRSSSPLKGLCFSSLAENTNSSAAEGAASMDRAPSAGGGSSSFPSQKTSRRWSTSNAAGGFILGPPKHPSTIGQEAIYELDIVEASHDPELPHALDVDSPGDAK